MTERIPQSTAKTVYFKAYLASDHVTEATGKTIAITISKNKGAFGNPSAGATNATEISSGWYYVDLSTTDAGTLGPVAVRGAAATIDDVGVLLEVVSATTGGATNLDAAVTSRLASASYTAPTNLTAAQIATGIWQDATAGDFTSANSVGKSIMNGVALGTGLTVNALASAERTAIADAMLDEANGVETGVTVRQHYRVALAAMAGKADGAANGDC